MRVPLLLAAALLSGCVSAPTPGVSPDLLQAKAGADPARSLDLMRQQGERFAGLPFLGGNRVELLRDGPASFAALQEAIRGARTRIDMESYEFDETAGGEFSDTLLAAAGRGVEVNLIYDAWGAVDTSRALFDRLRAGGVRVLEFNPLRPNERVGIELNKRDHRKLLCVDGRLAITGGVNISAVYHNAPKPQRATPGEQAWRDTDVRIEGPVVAQFERYFMETWRQQRGPAIADPPATPTAPAGTTVVQAIDGAPDSEPAADLPHAAGGDHVVAAVGPPDDGILRADAGPGGGAGRGGAARRGRAGGGAGPERQQRRSGRGAGGLRRACWRPG